MVEEEKKEVWGSFVDGAKFIKFAQERHRRDATRLPV